MKGMFVKDMEIMRGNMKTFIGVYIIAIFCFLSTSAGPSFLISYVSVLAAVMALNTIASDDMVMVCLIFLLFLSAGKNT